MMGRREGLENRNCKLESLEKQARGAGGEIAIAIAAAAAAAAAAVAAATAVAVAVAGLHHRHPVG